MVIFLKKTIYQVVKYDWLVVFRNSEEMKISSNRTWLYVLGLCGIV